jgi:uncharacterized protein YndB with AHSA1/START domain
MPTASDTRLLPVSSQTLWELVCDPHHLPRWWPRVERVEGVSEAAFTEVLRSERGRIVRADFEVIERDDVGMRLLWAQQVAGTPFARVLAASETELRLAPATDLDAASATEVTITLSQTLPGWFGARRPAPPGARMRGGALWSSSLARLGSPLVRRAAERTVKEALDGLQRIAV